MTEQTFVATVERLSQALVSWSKKTRPIAQSQWVRLQGIDRSNRLAGLDDLFFCDAEENYRPLLGRPLKMAEGELLDTGTLRNSFFAQVFATHAKEMDLSLVFRFQGKLRLTLWQSRRGHAPFALADAIVSSDEGEIASHRFEIGVANLLAQGSRLFWQAEALSDEAEVVDAAWEGRAPQATEGRMVVLIRTFGRTRAVQTLMRTLAEQAKGPGLASILSNFFFLIYDASPGVDETTYADLGPSDRLRTFAVTGPNLGGGGNMSVEILLLRKALEQSGVTVNELLLTDDDVQISLETLTRNWGATLFRRDNAFHTLPVFTLSEPRRIWEDGAFWGRFTTENPEPERGSLSPRLLRHGRTYKGPDYLDDVARLHHAEYSTFIFLSMPMGRVDEIGFPVAFFLRGDDIEYNLRHAAQGGITVSNPGLAGWHEPGHSYAQEYLSIAHGTIINMAYGQTTPNDLCKFFLERAQAHLSVGDVAGLTVYAEVLGDLIAGDRLLVEDFAPHALAVVARFRSFDAAFSNMPDEVVDSLVEAAARRNQRTAVTPFLYMQNQAPDQELVKVVLFQPLTGKRTVYDPRDPARMIALANVAGRLYAALADFAGNFDHWAQVYGERLMATTQPDFWQRVAEPLAFSVLRER
jgi:GT2 family glycosyltransferase